jgi:hypothetical protein
VADPIWVEVLHRVDARTIEWAYQTDSVPTIVRFEWMEDGVNVWSEDGDNEFFTLEEAAKWFDSSNYLNRRTMYTPTTRPLSAGQPFPQKYRWGGK